MHPRPGVHAGSQYDSLSRLWNAHNPESGNLAYSYDVNGNVSSKTDARSITVNYSYDSINRLIQKKYGSTVAASYGYDGVAGPANCPPALSASNPIGKRTSMCDAAGTESWSYPLIVGKGWQVVDKRTTNGVPETITTQNNFDGSVGTITYPSARVVSYSYSGAARPVSVTDTTNGINYVANATYAPFGGLTGMKNGNSITVTNSYYESRMQPHVLSASGAAGIILSQVYDFHVGNGDNGNVYQIANGKDPNRTQNFTYDALNRIAEAWSSGPQWGERFTTDGWSNLKSRDQIPGKTNYEPLSAPINNYNQLTGYGYDAAGNMTSNGGANYTYDAESRLSTAGGLTYTYDGDGNRVVKSGSTIYWGIGPLAESDLSGTLQHEYIFFAGKRVARLDLPTGSPNYYFENHIGSTSVVTDASGQCEQDIDYYPYGGVQSDNCSTPISQNYKFTGKERDTESGLDYFGARHYASNLGRFMVPDWAAKPTAVPYANFGNPQSLNLYSYVENNPVSRVDPIGHATEAVWYDSGGFGDPSFMGATDFETDAANQMAMQSLAQNTTQQRQLSPEGLQFIAKHETVGGKPNLTVYDDINGNPTIGYGHLVREGEDFSKGITKKQALDLLKKDVSTAEGFVNRNLKAGVSQYMFDALTSVAYNSPKASLNLIKQYDNVRGPLFTSDFVETLPRGWLSQPGLINRRVDEADLYFLGRY